MKRRVLMKQSSRNVQKKTSAELRRIFYNSSFNFVQIEKHVENRQKINVSVVLNIIMYGIPLGASQIGFCGLKKLHLKRNRCYFSSSKRSSPNFVSNIR